MANKTIIDTLSEWQKNYLYDQYEVMQEIKSKKRHFELYSNLYSIIGFIAEFDKDKENILWDYCCKRYKQENN